MSVARKGARLRATAAQIVDAVVVNGRSLDAALSQLEEQVDRDDRSLLRLLCYGALRHHWRLQGWIDALLDRPLKERDSVVNALLAIGLYQLTETRIPDHAVVSQTVDATRFLRRPKLAPLVNAVLRRARRDRIFDNPPADETALHDHPRWMLDTLQSDWPDDWQSIVAANNARAPMWLRVNQRHGSTADYAARLRAEGIDCATLAAAPQALRLEEPQSVAALPDFAAGHASVQDAAAQLAAPWLLQGVSGRVLDACAAPGGKSGHLLEHGGSSIELTCIDKDPARLDDVAATLDRLQFDATLIAADASKPSKWWDGSPYAAILVDAPCSASGVIRRHPDIKLLRRQADLGSLAARQADLLEALWPLLEPGGRLLYVTCSVFAAENDAVVAPFIRRNGDAREEHVLHNNNISDLMRARGCGGQILPGTAGMDGFYYASLVKVS